MPAMQEQLQALALTKKLLFLGVPIMPTVEMTSHLYRFFPVLEQQKIKVPAGSVRQVLLAVNQLAPGFIDYILDERGSLRRHVNLSVNDSIVVDRKNLSDYVAEGSTLFIFQALSGG